jgi:hypothetical protein
MGKRTFANGHSTFGNEEFPHFSIAETFLVAGHQLAGIKLTIHAVNSKMIIEIASVMMHRFYAARMM